MTTEIEDGSDARVYAGASGLGIVAGMRAFTAPAVMGYIARSGCAGIQSSRFGAFSNSALGNALIVLALGEMVLDKLPSTPKRTETLGLAARILSGAVCGATLCSAQKRSPVVGAIAGIFGAIGSTFAVYELRREATQSLNLPDVAVALIEDATAVWIGKEIGDNLLPLTLADALPKEV